MQKRETKCESLSRQSDSQEKIYDWEKYIEENFMRKGPRVKLKTVQQENERTTYKSMKTTMPVPVEQCCCLS